MPPSQEWAVNHTRRLWGPVRRRGRVYRMFADCRCSPAVKCWVAWNSDCQIRNPEWMGTAVSLGPVCFGQTDMSVLCDRLSAHPHHHLLGPVDTDDHRYVLMYICVLKEHEASLPFACPLMILVPCKVGCKCNRVSERFVSSVRDLRSLGLCASCVSRGSGVVSVSTAVGAQE